MSKRAVGVGVVVLLGVFFVAWGGFVIWDQWRAVETFDPVEAEVVSVGLRGDDEPVITYRYTVNGVTYVNDNVFPGTGRQGGQVAADVVTRYEEGQAVTAYVDPSTPARSFLVMQPMYTTSSVTLVVGLGIILFGFYHARPARSERVIGRLSSLVWRSGKDTPGTLTRLRVLLVIAAVAIVVAGVTGGMGIVGTLAAVVAVAAILLAIALRPTVEEMTPAAGINEVTVPYPRHQRLVFIGVFVLFVASMMFGVFLGSLPAIVSGWVVGVGALFLIGGLGGLFRLLRESHTYRSAQGTVISADAMLVKGATRAVDVADGSEIKRFSRIAALGFAPRVRYRYQVGAREYENDRFNPGPASYLFSMWAAQNVLQSYAAGDVVEVQYDPSDPSSSYLTRAGTWRHTALYAGLIVLGFALLLPLALPLVG